jgi:hypothetical protein
VISDEVRDFREAAQDAQKKLLGEQEQVRQLKKHLAVQEECWKGQVNSQEDELLEFKEKLLRKEEVLLTSQTESGDKISALQEHIRVLEKNIEEERQCNARVTEKKDSDLARLQKGIQDTIISINMERQKKEDAEEKIIELQEQLRSRDEELTKARDVNERELLEWKKTRQEEQAAWEKAKQEFISSEGSLRQDLGEQFKLVSKSLAIAEQQLAEEHRVRLGLEESLGQREQDVQRIASEREETVAQWRKMLESEQESLKKSLSDIQAEFDHVRQTRDEESVAARKEIRAFSASLEEEKRLLAIEKEENEQNRIRIERLDEDRQRLIQQLEKKENEWQVTLMREQELLQKQIEELRAKTDAQLQSREIEIVRLNEDLSLLNGQLNEIRQKFSLERNENNNRLSRIQEFEVQVRKLNELYQQEHLDWERKIEMLKEQMEQQKKSATLAQEETENQSKRDIQLYRDKINKLTAQFGELQRKIDFEKKSPSAEGERTVAPVSSSPQNSGTITRTNNRFYPGK